MRLLAHLVRADFRHHRWLLLAWLAVVVAASVVQGVNPTVDAASPMRTTIGLLGTLLGFAQFLGATLLVASMIHTHPVVGSTAFWLTRPIGPLRLLAAKGLLLTAAIVVVPVVAQIGVMLAYHVPAREMAVVSVQSALFSCFWLLVAAVLAAMTPNLAGFVLACGALLLAAVVCLTVVSALVFATFDGGDGSGRTQQVMDAAPQLVLLVAMLVTGLLLLATMYRTRSRLRALGVGAAGLVLAWLLAWAWPWGGLAPRLEDPAWTRVPGTARLAFDPATVSVADHAMEMGRTRRRVIRAGLVLDGLPPGWSSRVGLVEATFRVAGRGALASAPWGSVPLVGGDRNPIHDAIAHVLGVERLADGSPLNPEPAVVLNVRELDARAWAPVVGTYRGLFEIIPVRHAIEARLRPSRGAVHQHGAYRLEIDRVEYAAGEVAAEARESDVFSGLGLHPDRSYYLRNPRRSEAVEGSLEVPPVMSLPLPFGIAVGEGASGFVARRVTITFPTRQALRPSFAIDQQWLAGAELVIVSALQAKAFDRTLEVAAFPLKLDQPTTPQPRPSS